MWLVSYTNAIEGCTSHLRELHFPETLRVFETEKNRALLRLKELNLKW